MDKVMNYDIVFCLGLCISFFHVKFSDTSGVEGAIESDLVEILTSTPSAAETSERDIQ